MSVQSVNFDGNADLDKEIVFERDTDHALYHEDLFCLNKLTALAIQDTLSGTDSNLSFEEVVNGLSAYQQPHRRNHTTLRLAIWIFQIGRRVSGTGVCRNGFRSHLMTFFTAIYLLVHYSIWKFDDAKHGLS
jgi:hypothetical protein